MYLFLQIWIYPYTVPWIWQPNSNFWHSSPAVAMRYLKYHSGVGILSRVERRHAGYHLASGSTKTCVSNIANVWSYEGALGLGKGFWFGGHYCHWICPFSSPAHYLHFHAFPPSSHPYIYLLSPVDIYSLLVQGASLLWQQPAAVFWHVAFC